MQVASHRWPRRLLVPGVSRAWLCLVSRPGARLFSFRASILSTPNLFGRRDRSPPYCYSGRAARSREPAAGLRIRAALQPCRRCVPAKRARSDIPQARALRPLPAHRCRPASRAFRRSHRGTMSFTDAAAAMISRSVLYCALITALDSFVQAYPCLFCCGIHFRFGDRTGNGRTCGARPPRSRMTVGPPPSVFPSNSVCPQYQNPPKTW